MREIRQLIIILGLVLFGSCDNTPTTPGDVDGTVSIGQEGEIVLASLNITGGTLEIRAKNLSWDPIQDLAAMDVYLRNVNGAPISAPLHLAIVSLDPEDVQFINPDGLTNDGLPLKEFNEEFGADGELTEGESSDMDNFEFDVGGHNAFSIRFRADFGFERRGVIAGHVYRDDDQDGSVDSGEPGLSGVMVGLRLEKSDGSETLTPASTGSDGGYRFMNLSSGAYSLTIDLPDGSSTTSANPLIVTLLENDDGSVGRYESANFGVHPGISTEGLLSHYSFNGNAQDQSGNNNHGTVIGAVLATDRHGRPDMAYQMDGEDDYIFVQNSPSLNPTNAVSLSLWFRLDAHPIQHALITKGRAPGISVWSIFINFDKLLYLGIRKDNNGTAGVSYQSTESLIDSTWHHVAGIFDGQLMQLYFDGVLAGSESLDEPHQLYVTSEPLYIGHGFQTFHYFPGALDDIRIYERALSDIEVQGLAHE